MLDPLNNNQESEKAPKKVAITQQKEESWIIGDISDIINNNQNEQKDKAEENKKIIPHKRKDSLIDINISSFHDILNFLINNEYDLFILEPRENDIKISFRKEKVEKDIKYIKFPAYNKILLKAKSTAKLQLDETQLTQEWKWEIAIDGRKFKVNCKSVPSAFWEKILFKITEIQKKIVWKKSEKVSLWKMLWLIGIIFMVILIIWGAFITFIVMNANTLEDVQFFQWLGINLNDINHFIAKIVNFIFSVLIFIETIFLSLFLFKFFLTKKIFKKKRIAYAIFSIIILIITFSSGSAWMVINSKIKWLPNWQEMAYGDIKIYDNSKEINKYFSKESSLIQDTTKLIGPITLRYDLSNLANKYKRQWFKIEKYNWEFWKKSKEVFDPYITREFNKKGTTHVAVEITGINQKWETEVREVKDIKPVYISNLIKIEEKRIKSGGKRIKFDASDLEELWEIEWFFDFENRGDSSSYTWYMFDPWMIIIDEVLIGLCIKRGDKKCDSIEKVLVIKKASDNSIEGKIQFEQDIIKDLKYKFFVKDAGTGFGEGFIESFTWSIEDKVLNIDSKIGSQESIEKSSAVEHTFHSYWEHTISVELKNTSWQTKPLDIVINIPKKLRLKKDKYLKISDNGNLIEKVKYESDNHEYYINELWAPTKLRLDAKSIKANDILYVLDSVEWDIDGDGKIDRKWKVLNYNLDVEWNHTIEVIYHFIHRKIKWDKVEMKEQIYIDSIKRDAILDLKIEPETNYVPTFVRFDASKSEVKWKNIEKFIYDYGDGTEEERDAINPARRYTKAGEYDIKLTVVTTDGTKHTINKKLILKPQPQTVKIISSMKKAPQGQWIDFTSEESSGQISSYYWSFGDWDESTEANPTHSYETPWDYTVTLKLTFQNNNVLQDEMNIEISDE